MSTRSLDLGGGAHNPFHAEQVHGHAGSDLALAALPYADAAFDYVSAAGVLARVPRLLYAPGPRHAFIELMNEAWRVLRPGGHLMALTPAAPHPETLGDPSCVNPLSEQTFPQHFGRAPQAAALGFHGAFEVLRQEWRGHQLLSVLRKVAPPAPPADGPRVSVIIPVYNGARYLAATLDSVLAQSHPDFEVLCVDDGSSDGSLDILRSYAARDARLRLLQTPANQGTAPRVLNWALPHMSGDYFVYSSQDDLFSPDWLARMHGRALASGADAVLPDVVLHYPETPERDSVLAGLDGDRSVELSGREACLHSLDWRIPANALWRASLVRFFRFAEFGLNSDEYSGRLFFLNANKVVFSGGTFYYRQDNAQAVTKRMSPRSFDYAYTQLRLYQLLQAEGFAPEVLQQQGLRAVLLRNQLQQWLDGPEGQAFSPQQRAQAEASLARCTAAMRPDPLFAAVL